MMLNERAFQDREEKLQPLATTWDGVYVCVKVTPVDIFSRYVKRLPASRTLLIGMLYPERQSCLVRENARSSNFFITQRHCCARWHLVGQNFPFGQVTVGHNSDIKGVFLGVRPLASCSSPSPSRAHTWPPFTFDLLLPHVDSSPQFHKI
ncbi:hypothetical protein BDW22DRAFT_1092930 [Trametopsis cervina]|nr:hypothetical protein BDW22DRAFT_1092930 [Trametopsis cervina]